jgi:hypothetical protein
MHVIGHQAVSVQPAASAGEHASKMEEIERPVFVLEEARAAIVAALNHVDRDLREHDAGAPWHLQTTNVLGRR